jgi:hypothetical protein
VTKDVFIPKPVWALGFALEQTLRDATLAVFIFLILKRLQHILLSIHLQKLFSRVQHSVL